MWVIECASIPRRDPRSYHPKEVFVIATVDIPILLPDSIVHAAEVQARLRGVTLEEWVSRAIAERLDTSEGAQEFFRRRAAGASSKSLGKLLDKVPNRPPDPGDEL